MFLASPWLAALTQEGFERYLDARVYDTIGAFLPEILLVGFGIALLVADWFLSRERSERWLPVAAFAALLVVLGTLLFAPGAPRPDLFQALFGPDIADPTRASGPGMAMVRADGFAAFFKVFLVVATLFCVAFDKMSSDLKRQHRGEFFLILFSCVLGGFLMAAATNLLMIYLAVELVSISSFLLVGYRLGSKRAAEGSYKYLIYGAVASGLMLFGMSILYGLTGTLYLDQLMLLGGSTVAAGGANPTLGVLIGVLLMAGVGYKMAIVPMHFWCPDAYESAPIAVTAFLSVASKGAGFALALRLLLTLGSEGPLAMPAVDWVLVLGTLSILTMTLGNLAALWQTNVKRLLAYSSIAHAGYLLLGITGAMALIEAGAGSANVSEAVSAVGFYFWVYLFTNLGAFAVAIIVAERSGTELLSGFRHIGYALPGIAAGMMIIILSLIGVPPTGGFLGKFWLFGAAIHGGDALSRAGGSGTFLYTLAVIGVANAAVSAYYYFRIVREMYLVPGGSDVVPERLSWLPRVAVFVLVVPIVLLGLSDWWGDLLSLSREAVEGLRLTLGG